MDNKPTYEELEAICADLRSALEYCVNNYLGGMEPPHGDGQTIAKRAIDQMKDGYKGMIAVNSDEYYSFAILQYNDACWRQILRETEKIHKTGPLA